MTVTIKTPEDIEKMRVAGRLAAEVLEMIGEHVKPGVTTEELDRLCHDYIVNVQQATPAPLNYKGFPSRSAPRSTMWSATVFPTTSRSKTATFSISTSP